MMLRGARIGTGPVISLRRLRVIIVSLLAMTALGALSRVPYTVPGADAAMVRLSWRAPRASIDTCRALDPAEIAALPVHMRRDSACETRRVAYTLRVIVDGSILQDTIVTSAGVRADRPLFVYREYMLQPGEHRVQVEFVPRNGDISATLPGFSIDRTVKLEAGQILLITGED